MSPGDATWNVCCCGCCCCRSYVSAPKLAKRRDCTKLSCLYVRLGSSCPGNFALAEPQYRPSFIVAAIIDTAARCNGNATKKSMAISQPLSASNRCGHSANPAGAFALRSELQQASTALSSAEAGPTCLQRASSDQSAVSSSTQHDTEHVCGGMAHAAPGDDGPAEHMARDMEVSCAQEPADLPYTTATFHYSRHQVGFEHDGGYSVFAIASCTL